MKRMTILVAAVAAVTIATVWQQRAPHAPSHVDGAGKLTSPGVVSVVHAKATAEEAEGQECVDLCEGAWRATV